MKATSKEQSVMQQLRMFLDDASPLGPMLSSPELVIVPKIDRRKGPHSWTAHEKHDPIRAENHRLVEQGLKRCRTCKEVKPLSEFYPSRTNRFHIGGVYGSCKLCVLREARSRFTERLYGITAEQYQEMFEAQERTCAICGQQGKPPEMTVGAGKRGQSGVLVVDHDHITEVVRGLLCGNCNRGLGNFNDDPNLLEQAIDYLNRNQ